MRRKYLVDLFCGGRRKRYCTRNFVQCVLDLLVQRLGSVNFKANATTLWHRIRRAAPISAGGLYYGTSWLFHSIADDGRLAAQGWCFPNVPKGMLITCIPILLYRVGLLERTDRKGSEHVVFRLPPTPLSLNLGRGHRVKPISRAFRESPSTACP